jgi:DNA invertase Pin-like site-specific DNA recombinase
VSLDRSVQCRHPECGRQAKGVTGCCRDHQRWAWEKANRTTDGVSRGRGGRKLTTEQAAEARRMRSAFKSTTDIARHFGVSRWTIRRYLDEAVDQ